MATLFEGDGIRAQGEPDSLRTETNGNGRLQISGMFKICDDEIARDDRGQKLDVSGKKLAWYMTDSSDQDDKSRDRLVNSLTATGIAQEVAEEIVDAGRSGSVGDVPSEAGFGSKVSSLVVEIDEYQGKKRTRVKWVNDIDRRPKQREPGTPLKLKTLKTAGRKAAPPQDASDGTAPWEK